MAPTMTYVYAVPGEKYALVRGGTAGGWLRRRGIPAYRSNVHNGWWVRSHRVPDLLALASLDGKPVLLRDHDAPPHIPVRAA